MNERIRELATQADIWCDQNVAQGSPMYNNQWETKFAEMTVEECCKRLSEETIQHDGYGYNQHELYNRLRKHFGVNK